MGTRQKLRNFGRKDPGQDSGKVDEAQMNLPIIQSHRYARPTGLGFDPIAYVDGMQRVAMDDYYSNPMRGMAGVGATDQQSTAAVGAAASAIPVAGVFIAAAASVAVAIETLFSGCGQTCTAATN